MINEGMTHNTSRFTAIEVVQPQLTRPGGASLRSRLSSIWSFAIICGHHSLTFYLLVCFVQFENSICVGLLARHLL